MFNMGGCRWIKLHIPYISYFLSHLFALYWHRSNQSQHWSYIARIGAGTGMMWLGEIESLNCSSISVWQHVYLSEQIHRWDTLACCWNVKQPTKQQVQSASLQNEMLADGKWVQTNLAKYSTNKSATTIEYKQISDNNTVQTNQWQYSANKSVTIQ